MAESAPDASGETHEPLPLVTRDLAAEKSHGACRMSDLRRRLTDLRTDTNAVAAELHAVKRVREATEQELRGGLEQTAIAADSIKALEATISRIQHDISCIASELGALTCMEGSQRDDSCKMHEIDSITSQFQLIVSIASPQGKQCGLPLTEGHHASYKHKIMESEDTLKVLVDKVKRINSTLHILKGEYQYHNDLLDYDKVTVSCSQEKVSTVCSDLEVLKSKGDSERQFQPFIFPELPQDTHLELLSTDQGNLKDLIDEVSSDTRLNTLHGEYQKYLSDHDKSEKNSDRDGFISSSEDSEPELDLDTDTEDKFNSGPYLLSRHAIIAQQRLQFAALTATTRQKKRICSQPTEFSLPSLHDLDLSPQYQSKKRESSCSDNSNSTSSGKNSHLGDLDEIYDISGSHWQSLVASGVCLATDQEEEDLMMDVAVHVGDNMQAQEIILKHDEGEANRLEIQSLVGLPDTVQVRSVGASREFLLNLVIIFFGKEKQVESCRVCLSDFDTKDQCIRLHCNHIFHMHCLVQWLLEHTRCPVCRGEVEDHPDCRPVASEFGEVAGPSRSLLGSVASVSVEGAGEPSSWRRGSRAIESGEGAGSLSSLLPGLWGILLVQDINKKWNYLLGGLEVGTQNRKYSESAAPSEVTPAVNVNIVYLKRVLWICVLLLECHGKRRMILYGNVRLSAAWEKIIDGKHVDWVRAVCSVVWVKCVGFYEWSCRF